MKVIFMGTPDFSVGTLEALIEAGHEVVLAVTQPDKPKGRGKEMQFPPVKEAALRYGVEVYQPKRIRKDECVEKLRSYQADIMVVVAFGQILPKEILEMTPYGCVNVHASLLPKYRGAAPIQWAVIDGERESGVTTMQMDEGLDTGDMLLKTVIELDKRRPEEASTTSWPMQGPSSVSRHYGEWKREVSGRKSRAKARPYMRKCLTRHWGGLTGTGTRFRLNV